MLEEKLLLNIADVAKLTGWSEATVRTVMTEEADFPVIKIGKENQVSLSALKEWLNHRRVRRGE